MIKFRRLFNEKFLPETTLLSSFEGLSVEKRRIGNMTTRIRTVTIKQPDENLSQRVLVVPLKNLYLLNV